MKRLLLSLASLAFLLSISHSQTLPISTYQGVKTYETDLPFRVMPVYGLSVLQAMKGVTSNYIRPDTLGQSIQSHRPYDLQHFWTKRSGSNDYMYGLSLHAWAQHGGSNDGGLNGTAWYGQNFSLLDGTFTMNTDGQAGGTINSFSRHYGHGDNVGLTQDLFCTGVSRPQDEGCELQRLISGFHLDAWGETLGTVTTDSNGQTIFTATTSGGTPQPSANHTLAASSENGVIINTTGGKSYNTGNIALIGTCPAPVTDSTAVCITGDSASNWTARYGVTGFTTLAQAIANPSVGNDVLATGPYCGSVAVASSSIFTAGGLFTISANYDSVEVATVLTVPDSTHITACFGKPHLSGEMMTAGGTAVGHAISCSADDQAPGTLNFPDQGPNAATLRLAYPILGVLSGNIIVTAINSSTSNPTTLYTTCFASNMPSTSPSFTPNLSGGAIASWTVNNYGTVQTSSSGTLGGSTLLPPPTISFAGSTCTTLPTAHAIVVRAGQGWQPVTDTPGVGCTSLTTTVLGTTGNPYPNAYTIYPMAWARSNQDPNWTTVAGRDPTLVDPSNALSASTDGYMVVGGTIPGTGSDGFSVGDTVEMSYYSQQRMGSQRNFDRWIMGFDGSGTATIDHYKGWGGANMALHTISNDQASSSYYGNLANKFAQGTGGMGQLPAPNALKIVGAYSQGIRFAQPPRGVPGQDNGSLFRIFCEDATAPCANGLDQQYTVFDFEDNYLSSSINLQMNYNPFSNQLSFQGAQGGAGKPGIVVPTFNTSNGNCYATSSPASCGTAVIGQITVPAGTTTFTVNTSSIRYNTSSANASGPPSSRIWLSYSTVGITAPTNMTTLLLPYVSAMVNNASFTLTFPVAPATNAVQLNWGFADNGN